MKIYHELLSNVNSYIEDTRDIRLQDKEKDFESIFKYIKRFKTIAHDTKILEIGTGTGWFLILCKKRGICCKGLEISPQLVEFAKNFAQKQNIAELDIELANIETADIGRLKYDIIIATSSFEHIQHWQEAIKKVFAALKYGGVLYFYSSNKFAIRSGDYNMPFYSWLPNSWRYRLRVLCQGEDIMKWGVDFNQFTYFQLRHFFKQAGFSRILDAIDLRITDDLNRFKPWKKIVLKILKRFKPLKHLVLFFRPGTSFICIK